MDPVRKQLRQRLELDRLMGMTAVPRTGRLRIERRRPEREEDGSHEAATRPAASAAGSGAGTGQGASDDPVAVELATMDRGEVKGCRKCPLAETRTNTVFGEGDPHASLVFVGEAPGADEDAQGRPFVGRAGQLLNDIITKGMRLRREDVFICNVLKCRPPNNRTPAPDEVAACSPYLWRQLALIGPRVIVCLGKAAAEALLGTTESIGRLRGAVHELQIDPTAAPIPTIVTYHPAYLLRNYSREARGKVWADIQQAMTIAGIPIPPKGARS